MSATSASVGQLPRFAFREGLPARQGQANVAGIDLHAEAAAAGALGGNEGRAGAQERIDDQIVGLAAVLDRLLAQRQRLDSRMPRGIAWPRFIPNRVLLARALPARFPLPAVEDMLVTVVVVRATENEPVLHPNEPLVVANARGLDRGAEC